VTPTIQVAKTTISAAGGAATDNVVSAGSNPSHLPTTTYKLPAVYLSLNIASSSRALPLAATTTRQNVTSNMVSSADDATQNGQAAKFRCNSQERNTEATRKTSLAEEQADGPNPETTEPRKRDSVAVQRNKSSDGIKGNRDSISWLNWFSKVEDPRDGKPVTGSSGASSERKSNVSKEPPEGTTVEAPEDTHPSPAQRRKSDSSCLSSKVQQRPPPRSWLGLWGTTITQPQSGGSASTSEVATIEQKVPNESMPNIERPDVSNAKPIANSHPLPQPAENQRSYGWAFWTKDETRDDDGKTKSGSNVELLAKADFTTASKPESAVVVQQRSAADKVSKRERPRSSGTSEDLQKLRSAEHVRNRDTTSRMAATKTKSAVEASMRAKQMAENLVLPSFKQTYSHIGRATFFQQMSRFLQFGQPTESKHVSIEQNPPRVKRALAIGVHGYFPAPLIRSVLGQPTGTSIRFANSAASAIQKWTQDQGYSCEIEKVALEGEGKIAERIDLLWKLMLNWIGKIRTADFVMIACHSQGVPVAMMLVAKLIAFGCVNTARIGVCAMAGVNLGPFADYKSRWISGSAGELFDFARPDSQVSKDYEAALDVALRFGVKIVYVGSIDDQLVSLEVSIPRYVRPNSTDILIQSSAFGTVSHPYIYRAVFVDGRVHVPDFLTHLVGFALKLRNLGISDHGLIRELSTPLAGSLYGGEGHSRIYDDEAVYYLAVEHALQTTSLGSTALRTHHDNQATTQNPYILPFAMRGLLEEDYVRTELYSEVTELIKQFDDWKPSSKVLKDVKFRLEGVRSKL